MPSSSHESPLAYSLGFYRRNLSKQCEVGRSLAGHAVHDPRPSADAQAEGLRSFVAQGVLEVPFGTFKYGSILLLPPAHSGTRKSSKGLAIFSHHGYGSQTPF